MIAENVLFALNEIEDEFLEEAHADIPASRRLRRSIILIAAVIALLIVTACAAKEITGWLGSFFSGRAESDLSAGQIGYIAENEQLVSDVQKHNGYTVELKSYLATDDTVYVVFGITAPPNVDIAKLEHRIILDTEYTGIYGRTPHSEIVRQLDDGDGRSNTINYVCILEHKHYVYHTVTEWNVHIGSIFTVEYDETTNHTEYPILAEGNWNFTIDLTKADYQSMELLSAPIQTLGIIPQEDPNKDTVELIHVTSVQLTPLELFITYEPISDYNIFFEGYLTNTAIEFHIFAVMDDGSEISFSGGHTEKDNVSKCLADSPILLDQVDYILLADGTKIMVP